MLIKCPECELQVSDKAYSCPHCGNPFKQGHKSTRRKRLPNGFGQITKINKKGLRKPYRAMVTVAKDEKGKFIQKILKPQGYFETYNEAYAALLEYNKNPYDLESDMTVRELYEKWSVEYFKTLKSDSSVRIITASWAYCSSVYNMRAKDIRARHIKGCIEEGMANINGIEKTASAGTKSRIKSLFNLMLDYALEYEIVEKNYARTFSVSDEIIKENNDVKNEHISFTDFEMETLWGSVGTVPYADIIIIQCYSGWRPQELGLVKLENVDFETGIITGGMKTDSGTNRIVPIHPKIIELIRKRYDEAIELGSEYLFNCNDGKTHKNSTRLTYDKYNYRFEKVCDQLRLNPDHRPHDPRKHFITMAKKYKVDEYAIKYIVGHSITDITEKTYTTREIPWLIEEMKKIK